MDRKADPADKKTAKKVMQSAYVTYSSKPAEGKKRSVWADQVIECSTHHSGQVSLMLQGKLDAAMAIDPRDSKDADEKTTLGGSGMGISKQKTFLNDARTQKVEMTDRAKPHVNQFI